MCGHITRASGRENCLLKMLTGAGFLIYSRHLCPNGSPFLGMSFPGNHSRPRENYLNERSRQLKERMSCAIFIQTALAPQPLQRNGEGKWRSGPSERISDLIYHASGPCQG